MNFVISFSPANYAFSQVKEKRKKEKRRKKKRTVGRHLCLMLPAGLIYPVFQKEKRKEKGTVS